MLVRTFVDPALDRPRGRERSDHRRRLRANRSNRVKCASTNRIEGSELQLQNISTEKSIALSRRSLLAFGTCACGTCVGPHALANVTLIEPDVKLETTFDIARDAKRDEAFSRGMATMMGGFESAVRERKARLFDDLLSRSERSGEMSVLEIGAGSAPNAEFFARAARASGPSNVDLICLDPNDSMRDYAEENLRRFRSVGDRPVEARFVHGVAEALPLRDASVDAVVSTLTLCSVVDQRQALREIRRVLKPGGKFLFLEHVLSETDPKFARLQESLTPMQVSVADGCHLNRRTLQEIQTSGFRSVDGEYYELDGFWVIAPQVCGIAVA